jgi:hypothetical protein
MMRRMRGLSRIGAAEALEAGVERARLALACTFSSSAEYEASIIQAKRDAGVYGPKQRRRRLLLWFLAATVPIAFVILVFAFRDK